VTASLYDVAGGWDAVLRFARAHHQRCLADAQLRGPLQSAGVDPRRDESLAAHLAEVWGGPPASTHDDDGPAAWLARGRVSGGEDGELGHRLLDCFLLALDDADLPADVAFRTSVTAYLQWWVADLAPAPSDAGAPAGPRVTTWTWDSPVVVAAWNNADRIEQVARAADVVSHRDPVRWWAERRTPPLHPDAVTLARAVEPARVLAGTEAGSGRSVKDSFADVDLIADGMTVIIEGSWLWRGADRDATSPSGWTWDVPSRTGEMTARHDGKTVASCTITRSGPVVGVTNVHATADDDVASWREVTAAVARTAPNAPIVAWSPLEGVPAAVAAGFVVTGPMRVWSA
jgi:hemoglobin